MHIYRTQHSAGLELPLRLPQRPSNRHPTASQRLLACLWLSSKAEINSAGLKGDIMAHGHAANCLHLQQSGQRPTSCHTYSLTLIVLTAPNLIPQPPDSETPSICVYTKSFPLNSTYKRLLKKKRLLSHLSNLSLHYRRMQNNFWQKKKWCKISKVSKVEGQTLKNLNKGPLRAESNLTAPWPKPLASHYALINECS